MAAVWLAQGVWSWVRLLASILLRVQHAVCLVGTGAWHSLGRFSREWFAACGVGLPCALIGTGAFRVPGAGWAWAGVSLGAVFVLFALCPGLGFCFPARPTKS